MRDLVLILILAGLVSLTLLRPWLGVLALAIVGLLQPHEYAGGAAADWPVYKIIVTALALSMVISRETRSRSWWRGRLRLLVDWRVPVLALLWLLFLNSTLHSPFPVIAWSKLLEISSVLVTGLFALFLLDTRRKVESFLVTVALCIALVAVKGGYWALTTGFADRVYGPPGSQYTDNNHFAVLAVMGVPLMALFYKRAGPPALRWVLALAIALSVVAVLTSWSRGALLSLSATLVLLAVLTERRLALVPLAVLGLVFAFDLLPDAWFARMETIADYEQEGSAQGRLAVWRQGWAIALRAPFTGVGPDGYFWAASRDWHSAYVEVLAEHGFVALGVWLLLLLGTLISLGRCALAGPADVRAACGAVLVSLVGYAVGAAFLGLSYWEIYYQLLMVSVLLTARAAPSAESHGTGVDPSAPGAGYGVHRAEGVPAPPLPPGRGAR